MQQDYIILLKGEDKTKQISHYRLQGGHLVVVFKNNPRTYHYKKGSYTLLEKATNHKVFAYFKDLCPLLKIPTAQGDLDVVLRQYENLQYIPEQSAAALYLKQKAQHIKAQTPHAHMLILPFDFNPSQYLGITHALSHQMSIIQGPPGTGKTQCILNIIANILYQNKNVAVVSNNNTATQNIYDKLQLYGLDFICANLGKRANKESFIANQAPYPHLEIPHTDITLSHIARLTQKVLHCSKLSNKIAKYRSELNALKLEYEHFKREGGLSSEFSKHIKSVSHLSSNRLLRAKIHIEQNISFWLKLKFIFFYRTFILHKAPKKQILNILDYAYYEVKISELTKAIQKCESKLSLAPKYQQMLKEYSLSILRLSLKKRYKAQRREFSLQDMDKNAQDFLREYPIILSTTYSLSTSLNLKGALYDYVIIDEASQVDLVSGFLALSCAKNAIIVGDTKQLGNVITKTNALKIQSISQTYHIPPHYDFNKHSLLSSCLATLPHLPQVLLKEHYRCHPKIIEFCNQKFYDNQLITLTTDKGQKDVIKAISTPAGNHARNHLNQREIDVIINEILPDLSHIHPSQIGIITPYNQQKAALIAKLHPEIEIDTIHKFQGREKQAIILTSVDNEINDFINDKKILNVAISRAKRYLYLVYCPQFCKSQNHYNDFIAFIQYHRFETKPSQVKSIFDLLYKANQKARIAYLKGKKRISNYESENLLSALLDEILLKDSFSSLCYAVHIPLSRLVNNVENLQEMAWIDFINNTLTHIDFVIYHKFNKKPILCIEVDGFIYHQNPKQQRRDTMKDRILEHYGIALLRLPTTGSQEARIIEERLNSLL